MINTWGLDKIIFSLGLYRFYEEIPICMYGYTIIYTLENSAYIKLNEENFMQVKSQQFICIPPGKKVVLKPEDSIECLILELNPAFLLDKIESEAFWDVPFTSEMYLGVTEIRYDFMKLSYLYFTARNQKEYLIISHIYSLIQSLKNHFLQEPFILCTEHYGKKNREIYKYISNHIYEPFRMQDAAKAIGWTPQYLASYFQKNFGCTFLEYINQCKIKKALKWIQYTMLSDVEITLAFSFKNVSAFRKYVLEFQGKTVDEIRIQNPLPEVECRLEQYAITSDLFCYEKLIMEQKDFKNVQVYVPPEEKIVTFKYNDTHVFPETWKFILNVGYAYQMSDPRMRNQVYNIQKKIHFRYGRIYRPLDLVYCYSQNDTVFYNFESIFRVLDYFQELQLKPFLEVGYKDAKVHTRFTETYIISDREEIEFYYSRIIRILPQFIRACCNRYGINSVREWKFSVYYDTVQEIENDVEFTFWKYANYYNRIYAIVKQYLPDCSVGGLDFNVYVSPDNLKGKLEQLNLYGATLEFINLTVYGGINRGNETQLSLDPNHTIVCTLDAIKIIREYYPDLPIYISEFSFCYTSRNYLNDTVFQSSYIAHYICNILSDVQGMGYYTMSDISVQYSDSDEMFFGGNGMYNYAGIRKPAFYTYSFFSHLGNKLIGKTPNAIITADSHFSFQGIFYHYIHINENAAYSERNTELLTIPEQMFEKDEAKVLHFQIENVIPGKYLFKCYTIDLNNGNILQEWAKCRTLYQLKEKDLTFFKYVSRPKTTLYTRKASETGTLDFTIRLQPMEVTLILMDFMD